MFQADSKILFFLRNFLKGLLWLGIIVIAFVMLKNNASVTMVDKLLNLNPVLVYTVYFFSELIFGIIPPEVFMIWALKFQGVTEYIIINLSFALISIFCGLLAYFFGLFLYNNRILSFLKDKLFKRYDKVLNKYGVYLLIIAAITPIPFSAICIMIGAAKYPVNKFLMIIPIRILRFSYAWIIWGANMI